MDHARRAAEAESLLHELESPLNDIEAAIVKQLGAVNMDGSEQSERYCLELVRTLQAGTRFKRLLAQWIANGQIEEASLERKRAWKKGGI